MGDSSIGRGKEKAWMLPCLGVLSPSAWTPNNKVSCDFNQLKEQFLIAFHLDFCFLAISRSTTCFFGIKSHVRMTLFPFLSGNNRGSAQVARLDYLHFLLIAGSVPAAYVTGRALPGHAHSKALCQLSGWLCFSQGNESLQWLLPLHPWYWFLISYPDRRSGIQEDPDLVQAPVLFPSLYGSNGFPALPSLSSPASLWMWPLRSSEKMDYQATLGITTGLPPVCVFAEPDSLHRGF